MGDKIGSWLQTNVIQPAIDYMLQPSNLDKLKTVVEPLIQTAVSDATQDEKTAIINAVTGSADGVIKDVGSQIDSSTSQITASVTSMGNSFTSQINSVTGGITNVINAISNLNPFHLGEAKKAWENRDQ